MIYFQSLFSLPQFSLIILLLLLPSQIGKTNFCYCERWSQIYKQNEAIKSEKLNVFM